MGIKTNLAGLAVGASIYLSGACGFGIFYNRLDKSAKQMSHYQTLLDANKERFESKSGPFLAENIVAEHETKLSYYQRESSNSLIGCFASVFFLMLGGLTVINFGPSLVNYYSSRSSPHIKPFTLPPTTKSPSKPSGLETKVKQPEIPPPKFTKNPFEYDLPKIDKIENIVYSGQNLGGRN